MFKKLFIIGLSDVRSFLYFINKHRYSFLSIGELSHNKSLNAPNSYFAKGILFDFLEHT